MIKFFEFFNKNGKRQAKIGKFQKLSNRAISQKRFLYKLNT